MILIGIMGRIGGICFGKLLVINYLSSCCFYYQVNYPFTITIDFLLPQPPCMISKRSQNCIQKAQKNMILFGF